MRSIFRIYAKTSKGNDNYLSSELSSFGIQNIKYDQHLNSYYFNSNFKSLFDICYKSMAVEQMYIQLGQKFRIIDEQQIVSEI